MKKIVVTKSQPIRLDKFVAEECKDLSRTMIQKLIQNEKIQVNGKRARASLIVKQGDQIEIEPVPVKDVKLKAQDLPIEVLYEDKDIIVVNKPKGMVVHPASGNPDGTLVNAIMNLCKDSLSGIGGELRPGIVHRLDKDTSGVIMIAKHDQAHIALSQQIKQHQVQKTYLALVRGVVKEEEATIHMPIGRSTKDRKKMAVTAQGKDAITHFKVLERWDGYTLLEIIIETGRTHQIRVHLSHIGYPVVGDMVYSNGKNPFEIKGQMLHAYRLIFHHPVSKQEMKIEAPLPAYFEEVLKTLTSRQKQSYNIT